MLNLDGLTLNNNERRSRGALRDISISLPDSPPRYFVKGNINQSESAKSKSRGKTISDAAGPDVTRRYVRGHDGAFRPARIGESQTEGLLSFSELRMIEMSQFAS